MKLKYHWEEHPEVTEILNNIYINSQQELAKIGYPVEYANEFISDIEDMLNHYKKYHYDLTKFINALKEIESIAFIQLSSNYVININTKIGKDYKTLPPVINKNNQILINPFLDGDENLSINERRRLYLYHGILRHVIKLQNETTKEFSEMYTFTKDNKIVSLTKEEDKEMPSIVNNGWLLLEEVIAQAEAENITYRILGKQQPQITLGTDHYDALADYKYGIFSELELYRMYEPLLINFGMAISDVGTLMSHDKTTIKLKIIRKALKENLSNQVISEYIQKDKEFQLYQILYGMGLLINEKHAIYGKRNFPYIKLKDSEVLTIYQNIIDILERNATLSQIKYSDEVSILKKEKEYEIISEIRSLKSKIKYSDNVFIPPRKQEEKKSNKIRILKPENNTHK